MLYQTTVGSSSTDYIFPGGMRIGKVTGTTSSYYQTDALGSTRLVTSSSGSVLFAEKEKCKRLETAIDIRTEKANRTKQELQSES